MLRWRQANDIVSRIRRAPAALLAAEQDKQLFQPVVGWRCVDWSLGRGWAVGCSRLPQGERLLKLGKESQNNGGDLAVSPADSLRC
ncbi:hypothetical protein DPEC_G00052190 [Dallia pectoralis]|uniref:Uncharacterized protein n=1 Tax=Dallia pectoralis TaxID=75939 RepID=A0ACC2HBF9_DALPE|nr:hypothetical protein DPEC_G00052190 [Dallia pectoralis]